MIGLVVAWVMTVVGAGGCGVVAGLKLRGLIPLRAPSNRVRLENARTDALIEQERAEAELKAGQARAALERVSLEQDYSRAVASLEVSKIDGFQARASDDVDVLLRVARADRQMSQRELGQRTRIRPSRISAIENGSSPTHDELVALAETLHLDLVPARLARKVPVEAAPFLRGLPEASIEAPFREEAEA